MNSEKVKEIKKALEYNVLSEFMNRLPYADEFNKLKMVSFEDILTLINELESDNERLNKSDTSKEESSIEYYNLYKDFKRKNKDLNELCERQRVSIAESFVRENQLKDRIAKLEKEVETRKAEVLHLQEYGKKLIRETELKHFAERLKKKGKSTYDFFQCPTKENKVISISDIDETLKEFIE